MGQVYHMRGLGHLSRYRVGGSSKPPRRVGVVDRITKSGEGTSLEAGGKPSVRASLIVEAVPDCDGLSRTCRGGRAGAPSDKGAGAGISRTFAAQSQFGECAPFQFL